MTATSHMKSLVTAVCLGLLVGGTATGIEPMRHPPTDLIWQWDGPIPENPDVNASLRLYHDAGSFFLTAVGSRGNCVVDLRIPVVSSQNWRLYQRCATGTVVGDVMIDGYYTVSGVQRSGSSIAFTFSFSGVVWDEITAIWPSKNTHGLTLGSLTHTWQVSGSVPTPPPAPTPAPATATGTGATYQIVALFSGKCVDVAGVSVESGTQIYQWDCLGTQQRNQVWQLRPARDGLYMVIAQHSNKCMDVQGMSQDNGAAVIQWDCLFMQANQLWAVRDLGGGRVALVASHSGKCLTLRGPTIGNSERFIQFDCDPSTQLGQLLMLRPIL